MVFWGNFRYFQSFQGILRCVRDLDALIEDYTRVPKLSQAFQVFLKVPVKSGRHPKLQKTKIGQGKNPFGRATTPFGRMAEDSGKWLKLRANQDKIRANGFWNSRNVPRLAANLEWSPIRANSPSIRSNESPRLRDFFSLQTKLWGLLGHFTPFVS